MFGNVARLMNENVSHLHDDEFIDLGNYLNPGYIFPGGRSVKTSEFGVIIDMHKHENSDVLC